ncbi:MAG: apolipoprotein N-acyltransferase [Acidobacteriota bacterium]|nr:apolipoprotein N-acyltransferase [Acidobacteriota bacterium]
MRPNALRFGAAVLSAVLLELPFPIAGPMPVWRSVFAWFGLVPLLVSVLGLGDSPDCKRPFRSAFLVSYLCGFLWYMGNCYWVRDTMMRYGDMPTMAPTLLLIGFSLVLGLYFGVFGLVLMLLRRATGSVLWALAAAPFVWTALELAAARITSVPWDQLGYSQVDNLLVNRLATWSGVYGISFLLVVVNAFLAGGALLSSRSNRLRSAMVGSIVIAAALAGLGWHTPPAPASATAVLVQPNLDVASDDAWAGERWNQHIDQFVHLAVGTCKPYIAGIPQTEAVTVQPDCAAPATHPDLVAWPESPAPFAEADPRVGVGLATVAHATGSPLVIGSIGMDYAASEQQWHDYNSALIVAQDGAKVGRYDKIHLVPFGEFVPFKDLLFFARKLTGRVSEFTRGSERKVFRLNGHRYGVFICYEAVFADEVRQFSALGAEVLVNISDDGWYGDTSAPWQHLNMARMRAVENRRWLLRDTNNGVTAVIDPYGRVVQSIPRHVVDALPARYGFRDEITFYSAHGDVFAWVCAILTLGLVGWALRASLLAKL